MRAALLAAGVSVGATGLCELPIMGPVLFAAEDLAKSAATVEEVAKVLDLRTQALPEGATFGGARQLGALNYSVKGDLKSAFKYQQQQLTKAGWKELPGTQIVATSCSGMFQKSGFVVSVMCFDAGGMSQVVLSNFGNLQLSKVPVVKGAKSVFANEASANFSVAMKPAEAAAATRKLLIDAGWEPFGSLSNPPDLETLTFKRNAVQLSTFISASQVEKGSSGLMYSASVISVDIPAPTNAEKLIYADHSKTLEFETSDDHETVAKFYRQRLAKQGWKPTTEQLIKQEDEYHRPFVTQVFRNDAKDILTLNLDAKEGQSRAKLAHLTGVEVAAIEKRQKEAAMKLVAQNKADEAAQKAKPTARPKSDLADSIEKAAEDAIAEALKGIPSKKGAAAGNDKAKDKDAVSVPIPDSAKKVTQTSGNVLQVKFPGGKGESAATIIRDQLLAAGWEAEDGDKLDKTSGNVPFTKAGKTLTMTYVDAGVGDVNLMLIGIGVKLEQGKVDPDAKGPVAKAKPKSKPDADSPDDEPIKKLAKKAGKKPSKSADDDTKSVAKSVVEPKRVEKPARGLAKLDKLPNDAKVIVNDEPVKLPHLIAYETISDNRWVTKVIASELPIKQSSLLALLQKSSTDEGLNVPSPQLTLELDDKDSPNGMKYTAPQTIGSASGSKLIGEAIVEEGRARGKFKSKEPSEFFGRTISGDITFDLPVLTRDSKLAKQLTDAPKLETSGKLLIDDKPIKLGSVVVYEVKVFDEKRTAIFFTEKPINMAKLKASLAKDGTDDDLFEFQSQVKVVIDKDDRPSMMNLWHDGASINSNANLVGDVIIEDGRARGTIKLSKPSEFIGKMFSFEITFDVDVLPLPAKTE